MRRRGQDETDEELEGEGELVGAAADGDLGSLLSGVQEAAGNHALASLVAQVEAGDDARRGAAARPAGDQEGETERERKGAATGRPTWRCQRLRPRRRTRRRSGSRAS